MHKTLIEEPNVELLQFFDKVSEEARKEKNAIPPINKLAHYWTRKPLVVGRAIALASTLTNLKDVESFMGFGKDVRAYTRIPDAGVYAKKLGSDPSKIKVLDPFGGAGNLIFESLRLGLNCTISDYNPLAYLIEKAVLEYPSKYGQKLVNDFTKYATEAIELTKKEIKNFYGEDDLIYFWVWCIKCPHCGQRVPLTNNMWIANSAKNKIGIKIKPTKSKGFEVELVKNITPEEGKKFTQKGGTAICISCTNSIDSDYMCTNISNNQDRELIVIQRQTKSGREYVLAEPEDDKRFKQASNYFTSKLPEYEKMNLIPNERIKSGDIKENRLWKFGIKHYNELFSERQLLLLSTLLKNFKVVCKEILDKDYQKIISVYMGFVICKQADMNSFGAHYDVSRENPQPAFALKQPSMVFNHPEINPFKKVRGGLLNIIKNISNAIEFAQHNKQIPQIFQKSVTSLQNSETYDLIITDPPYADDVIYGEISEFFYVWISRLLHPYFSELPKNVPLEQDFCEAIGRFGDKKLAEKFFEEGLKKSFISMNSALKNDGLLVVFFAHSSPETWNLLLKCIREAKFSVVTSYAIHTENTSNVMAIEKAVFMSSIVIACRKLNKESTAYLEDIIPKAEDEIKKMLDKIPNDKLLLLPITDLLIMVYGKVLESCTQHTVLKSYQKKDEEPDFDDLVNYPRDFILKQIIDKITDNKMNQIGPVMSFYLLLKVFYHGTISSDEAIKITQTYGVNLDTLYQINVAVKEKGIIRLTYLQENKIKLKPQDLDSDNLYQQLCYLGTIAQTKATSNILAIFRDKENIKIDELKQIISIVLKSYNLRRNKGEGLDADEQQELKILEKLADILGVEHGGVLDSFMEKE